MNRLEDKSTVVTGAGRGLGAAVAELFAVEGARVVVADVDFGSAQATAMRINASGGQAISMQADVTSAGESQAVMEAAVNNFGGIDVLINNAGIASAGSVTEVSEEEWDHVMAVNAKGAYLCSRSAIPYMELRGSGSIVCISSASGVIGQRGQVAYNVSKHAAIGLVRCLALDHASAGIRANAVCPGVMNTPMLEALNEAQLARLQAMHPLGRLAEPAEVALLVLHLASDESAFTTGGVFLVDGGLTAM